MTVPGDATGPREAERVALLDSLSREFLAIHQEELARSVARLKWASEERRAAARARMVVELFDLRGERASRAMDVPRHAFRKASRSVSI